MTEGHPPVELRGDDGLARVAGLRVRVGVGVRVRFSARGYRLRVWFRVSVRVTFTVLRRSSWG